MCLKKDVNSENSLVCLAYQGLLQAFCNKAVSHEKIEFLINVDIKESIFWRITGQNPENLDFIA